MRNLFGPARIAKERGHKPQGIYRGRLAEQYDGIGQYVSVALAGSSVGSAYKARVAAGDFGGGRTFPKGTPVTVFSFRGNLEVMLGNIPNPCDCCGDCFKRTVASGWGSVSSPIGLDWQPRTVLVNQDRFSVNGQYGLVDSNAAIGDTDPLQMLDFGSGGITIPFEVLVKFQYDPYPGSVNSWDIDPIGIGTTAPFAGIEVRSGVFGFSTTATGINTTDDRSPGAPNFNNDATDFGIAPALTDLYYRTLIDERGVYARVWESSNPEPTTTADAGVPPVGGRGEAWHAWRVNESSVQDSYDFRYFFLRADNSRSGQQVIMKIDTVCFVQGVVSCSGGIPITDECGITDTFDGRTTGDASWGTSDANIPWQVETTEPTVHSNVAGGVASLRIESDADFGWASLPFTRGGNYAASWRFRYTEKPVADGFGDLNTYLAFSLGQNVNSGGVFYTRVVSIRIDPGVWALPQLELQQRIPMSEAENARIDFDFVTNTWYNFKWENEDGVAQRLKVWADGDSEPSSWTLTTNLSGKPGNVVNGFSIDQTYSNGVGAFEFEFDQLYIEDVNAC